MECDRLIAVCAHRYALGRRTYMPSHVAEWLTSVWDELPANDRKQIRQETQHSIDTGCAGDDCDVQTWKWFLEKTQKGAGDE